MADPRVVGTGTGTTTGLVAVPDGIQWDVDAQRITATCKLTGPYADCKAALIGATPTYEIGKLVTGEGEFVGLRCDKGSISKKAGDRGVLTWTFSLKLPRATSEDQQESEPVYEVEYARIERPLESHPRYKDAKNLQGEAVAGFAPVTEAYFALVKEYLQADEARRLEICDFAAQSGQLYPDPPSNAAAAARDLLSKRIKGAESFIIFSPVIRETTEISALPQGEGAGMIEDPPEDAAAPEGYKYLSTGVRRSNDGPGGIWKRTREWTGAYEWDTDLYPKGE